jgi:hypothetical protein
MLRAALENSTDVMRVLLQVPNKRTETLFRARNPALPRCL